MKKHIYLFLVVLSIPIGAQDNSNNNNKNTPIYPMDRNMMIMSLLQSMVSSSSNVPQRKQSSDDTEIEQSAKKISENFQNLNKQFEATATTESQQFNKSIEDLAKIEPPKTGSSDSYSQQLMADLKKHEGSPTPTNLEPSQADTAKNYKALMDKMMKEQILFQFKNTPSNSGDPIAHTIRQLPRSLSNSQKRF